MYDLETIKAINANPKAYRRGDFFKKAPGWRYWRNSAPSTWPYGPIAAMFFEQALEEGYRLPNRSRLNARPVETVADMIAGTWEFD